MMWVCIIYYVIWWIICVHKIGLVYTNYDLNYRICNLYLKVIIALFSNNIPTVIQCDDMVLVLNGI